MNEEASFYIQCRGEKLDARPLDWSAFPLAPSIGVIVPIYEVIIRRFLPFTRSDTKSPETRLQTTDKCRTDLFVIKHQSRVRSEI